MSANKVISSKVTNVSAKLWMIGSALVELTMTILTWSVLPLFFKLWSVFFLLIDSFLIVRDFTLNPVKQRKAVGIYA